MQHLTAPGGITKDLLQLGVRPRKWDWLFAHRSATPLSVRFRLRVVTPLMGSRSDAHAMSERQLLDLRQPPPPGNAWNRGEFSVFFFFCFMYLHELCGVQYKSPSACACACACACADGTALLGNGGPHVYAIAADPEWCSLAKELQLAGIPPLQYQLFAPVYSCIFLYIFLYIILYILSGGGGGVCVCVDLTRNRLALERHAHNLHMLRRKVF